MYYGQSNYYGAVNYGIGPGTPITAEVRQEAMMAPLFALGARDWFYVAIGAVLVLLGGWIWRRFR